MLYFFQQVLNGLHSGALYALLAFGYVLTNGILHRTNLAYGAVFAFCGQTMILTAVFGYQVLWLTLPATVAFGIAVAFLYALLIGHMDTVYQKGILAAQPWRVDGNRIYGPGIADDKGGLAVILHSLKNLGDAGWRELLGHALRGKRWLPGNRVSAIRVPTLTP